MIKKTKDKNKDFLRIEYFRICLIYIIIGFLWVYFSDSIVIKIVTNKHMLRLVNTYKGFFYILITTIILYRLIKKLVIKMQLAETQLSKSDKNLSISESNFRNLFHYSSDAIFIIDENKVVECNEAAATLLECDSEREIVGRDFSEFASKKQIDGRVSELYLEDIYNHSLQNGKYKFEWWFKKESGNQIPTEVMMTTVVLNGKKVFHSLCRDISERKQMEEKLQYLSFHDHLTGLYNRRFFEQEWNRMKYNNYMPLTITLADINGLKLINDSFGHVVGDDYIVKIAQILKKSYRKEDVVCRLAGDEFVILSPRTNERKAEELVRNFNELAKTEKVNAMDLSISIGYSTQLCQEEDSLEVYKKAEDYMYKKKLFDSPSMRGKTINTIITTLHEKNPREELHSRRVSELCEGMGRVLEFPEDKIRELKMVGLLHDIGKIAVEEGILNKPGKLTKEEWEEIKKHPEIGYRILSTVNDLSEMAEYVLAHHERWDGKGYPKGLKAEEIPIESRIIAIADTYDAIVSERSYRSALSKEFAISELIKNAGTQFSEELVSIFVEKVI